MTNMSKTWSVRISGGGTRDHLGHLIEHVLDQNAIADLKLAA
jgi:hypothetical protein